MGQGTIQLIQLISGFCLINWLTKDAYATFTLVMAIQSMTSVLVELTVSQSLTALIGSKIDDAKVVGRYVAACRFYRDRMLIVGSVVVLFVFLLIAPKYGWTDGLWFLLWLSVVVTLVFQARSGIYGPIFLLKRDLVSVYRIGISSGIVRFLLLIGAYFFGVLSAPLALMYGALQACMSGWASKELTKNDLVNPLPKAELTFEKKGILSQSVPRMPSTIFYAFEGQVAIFLISFFGTTSGIAEIGALSRLGMLFLIFEQTGSVLIIPYFAKMEASRVKIMSLLFIAGAILFFFASSAFAYLLPEPLLFVLGDGYQHLKFEIFLIISASGVRVMTMVILSVCMARKYIFPWFSIIDVVPLLIVMALGFALVDLSQLSNVLYLTLAMAVTKMLSTVFILFVGMRRETGAIRMQPN